MYTLLVRLFYACGLCVLIHEIKTLVLPGKTHNLITRIHGIMERKMSFALMTPTERQFLLFNLGYSTWAILGLATVEWRYFVGMIVLSVISSTTKLPRKYVWALMIDATLSIIIVGYMLINKFQSL